MMERLHAVNANPVSITTYGYSVGRSDRHAPEWCERGFAVQEDVAERPRFLHAVNGS